MLQGRARGEIAAHAVYSASWGGRRGADIETFIRCGIRGRRNGRAREHLGEILYASIDIASDIVRVVMLHIPCSECMASLDALAEAGSETLNLRLNTLAHINVGAIRHVTVSPNGLLPCGSAGTIEEALLRE